jgi:hypothetical protein
MFAPPSAIGQPFLKSVAHLNNNDGYDKIKVEIEFNKEVTSASSGLVYVCFFL